MHNNDTELRNDLFAIQNDDGGTLTFNCGTAIIVLTGGVLPNINTNTIVDGGGVITLSGGNATRIFTTGTSGTLNLKNITLARGSGGFACAATDQRGVRRPLGPQCDMGAFEFGSLLYLPLIVR